MRLIIKLAVALVALISLSLMVAAPAAAASLTTHTPIVYAVTAAGEASPVIDIPAIPAGVLVLLQFLSPYAIAIAVNPRWNDGQKKLVAIIVSIVLTAVVLTVAVLGFGLAIDSWWSFGLLGIVVSQSSYALVTGKSARNLALNAGAGKS